ncbi:MAG: DUF4163 domain-containing protein [Eubacteriaceae bacterium]|nr:DUF4163 domain-containing protein [Eubacteriaceae bacterium]
MKFPGIKSITFNKDLAMRLIAIMLCLSILITSAYFVFGHKSNFSLTVASQEYQIISNFYKDRDISIEYPQILGLSNEKLQAKINKTIKARALSVLDGIPKGKNPIIELTYEPKLLGTELLSVAFTGSYVKYPQQPPEPVFFTSNVNLKDGKAVGAKHFFYFDKNFTEAIVYQQYYNEMHKTAVNYLKDQKITGVQKLLRAGDGGYGKSEVYSYFTPDGLGLSFEVPNAIGGTAVFEIDYSNFSKSER